MNRIRYFTKRTTEELQYCISKWEAKTSLPSIADTTPKQRRDLEAEAVLAASCLELLRAEVKLRHDESQDTETSTIQKSA